MCVCVCQKNSSNELMEGKKNTWKCAEGRAAAGKREKVSDLFVKALSEQEFSSDLSEGKTRVVCANSDLLRPQ